MNTQINERLVDQIDALVNEQLESTKRMGCRGFHCFYCGQKSPLVACRCGFGRRFGCGRNRVFVCAPCAKAHEFVADRLRELFKMPIVNRVRSRRERAFYLLLRAASEDGCDGDLRDIDERPDDCERLRFYLSHADAYEQTETQFEKTVLQAFRLARFLDWQKLAAEYRRQSEEEAIAGLIRLGIR